MLVKDVGQTGIEVFLSYLRLHNLAVPNNYFKVDVVAGAQERISEGENPDVEETLSAPHQKPFEELTQKATQVYILTRRVIYLLRKNKFPVDSFFINISCKNPKVIIAVKNDFLLDDNFVELAYSEVFKMKEVFQMLFGCALNMGLIGSDHLDKHSLFLDGFEYSENFQLAE